MIAFHCFIAWHLYEQLVMCPFLCSFCALGMKQFCNIHSITRYIICNVNIC